MSSGSSSAAKAAEMVEAVTSIGTSLVTGIEATTSRVPGVAPRVAPSRLQLAGVVPIANTWPSLRPASAAWPSLLAEVAIGN